MAAPAHAAAQPSLSPPTPASLLLLLTVRGSHATRLNLARPAAVLQPNNPELEGYDCPPGSAVIWTESLTHAAAPWTPKEGQDRVAIFCMYNSVWARW